MIENETIAALGERRLVVVRVREDRDVVPLALLEEDGLIAVDRSEPTPEIPLWGNDLPPFQYHSDCGFLIVIVNVPSATLSIAALQYHAETVAPRTIAGPTFETARHGPSPSSPKGRGLFQTGRG